jgi:hypothetical protein
MPGRCCLVTRRAAAWLPRRDHRVITGELQVVLTEDSGVRQSAELQAQSQLLQAPREQVRSRTHI